MCKVIGNGYKPGYILSLKNPPIGGFVLQKTSFSNKSQIRRRFLTAADIELFEDTVYVVFDRANFDHQMLCDLLVGEALAN